MMNMNEFTNYVVERLTDYMPPPFQNAEVELHEVLKDNGKTYHGVNLHLPGKDASPILYIEDMYDRVISGTAVNDVIRDTAESFIALFEKTDLLAELISLKGTDIRQYIFFKLVSGEDNGAGLKNYPHKRIENLVKIYFLEPAPGWTIKITYDHLKDMGIDLQELDRLAQQNSMAQKPAELTCMNGIFLSKERNLLENDDPLLPDMYVLTNREKTGGASVICYPGVLAQIGRKLCADFYVLPSSIDEVIIMPKFRELSPKHLGKIVREANADAVAEGHILSNCVYEYSRKKDTLAIAPGSQERKFKEKGR
ncbi:DUF5688 family protein [Anaerovoracaceae bacterium 41-7]